MSSPRGCILFEICKRTPFQKCIGWGGGGHIFQRSVHTNMALHRSSIFTLNHCHRQHSLFQAGLGPQGRHPPVCGQGQISSILANPATSVPSLAPNLPKPGSKGGGLSGRQNVVLLVGACRLLRTGWMGLFCLTTRPLPSHLDPLCTPRASPFARQRLLWCIRGSNSPWSEFVCRHGSCLLTKRGSKEHGHRPKWTKILNMSSVQHADLGCIPHIPLPPEHSVGTNEATMAPTPENPQSWHIPQRPREILQTEVTVPLASLCTTATSHTHTNTRTRACIQQNTQQHQMQSPLGFGKSVGHGGAVL